MADFILGFDPGGQGNFGWSVCKEVGDCLSPPEPGKTGLANDAWDAMKQVKGALPDNPTVLAAGIDAPLQWNKRGDRKGYRKADCELRRVLEETQGPVGRVLPINSLYGAVVVQGSLLVRHLSHKWDLAISESHPKVLEHLLCHMGQPEMVCMVNQLTEKLCPQNDRDPIRHERDATLCAVSAWAMRHHQPGWQNLYDGDFGLLNPSPVPVGYWMPSPPLK